MRLLEAEKSFNFFKNAETIMTITFSKIKFLCSSIIFKDTPGVESNRMKNIQSLKPLLSLENIDNKVVTYENE